MEPGGERNDRGKPRLPPEVPKGKAFGINSVLPCRGVGQLTLTAEADGSRGGISTPDAGWARKSCGRGHTI